MTLTERFKSFTILHSNDMHGDFLAEATGLAEGHVIGGMSLLSGYINSYLAPGKLNVYSVTKCKRTHSFKVE